MRLTSLLLKVAVLVGLCWSSLAPAYGQQDSPHPGAKSDSKAKPKTAKTQKKTRGGSQRGVTPEDAPVNTTPAVGPYYALVIGINNYRSLPKLKTAVYDAKEVAK